MAGFDNFPMLCQITSIYSCQNADYNKCSPMPKTQVVEPPMPPLMLNCSQTFKEASTYDWSINAEIFYPISSQDFNVDPGPDSWPDSGNYGYYFIHGDLVENVRVAKVGTVALFFLERQNWHRKHHSLQVILFVKVMIIIVNLDNSVALNTHFDGSDLITPSNYDKLEAAINYFGSSRRQSGRAILENFSQATLYFVIGHNILYVCNDAMILLLLNFFVPIYIAIYVCCKMFKLNFVKAQINLFQRPE